MNEIKKLADLLPSVRDLACRAGSVIRDIYERQDFKTVFKADKSPLTCADQASHNLIVETLNKLTPDLPVLSEESKDVTYADRSAWNEYWLVDPLDGTKEFIKHNGEFTVNIALIREGNPVIGVVHAPILNLTYGAAKGSGAWMEAEGRERRSIRVADYRSEPLTIIASRSHRGDRLKAFLEQVGDVKLINMGSSLKLCLIAEGKAHFYPRLGPTMEWDTAAGHCVVEEAGGSICGLDSSPLRYNKEDLLNPLFVVCGDPPYPWQELI
ncbi:MAG: 3'(2'),5'-bisphosphate nucleotidase CysQ [Candidatus Omnitrophota bacterium]|nr:3'(2'),5'-bisphosphate nucleotidase CysQ [Candidatus Omnitrophota bacterium]